MAVGSERGDGRWSKRCRKVVCVWGLVGWGEVRKGGTGLSGSLSKTSKGSERSCTCQVINDDATVRLADCLSVGALW